MTTPDRILHSLPPPPDDLERLPLPSMSPDVNHTPHHWQQGPADVTRLARPFTIRDSAGTPRRMTHRFRWYLDRVEGTTRAEALRRIYQVLRHPRSWERSGVAFTRTFDRNAAHIWLRVIPSNTTRCGPGSAGCYSFYPGQTPLVEVGVEYINNPNVFAVILGMELAHAAFRVADMYTPQHQPYLGVLGTWSQAKAVGYYPIDDEITASRLWLEGRARYVDDDS